MQPPRTSQDKHQIQAYCSTVVVNPTSRSDRIPGYLTHSPTRRTDVSVPETSSDGYIRAFRNVYFHEEVRVPHELHNELTSGCMKRLEGHGVWRHPDLNSNPSYSSPHTHDSALRNSRPLRGKKLIILHNLDCVSRRDLVYSSTTFDVSGLYL